MAKYRHRVFEMYDNRDEAEEALRSHLVEPAATDAEREVGTFRHLAVSNSAGVTLVAFKDPQAIGKASEGSLGEDLSELRERLEKDSKVLLDFTGVESFSPASIESLVMFNKHLKNKGSRIVLSSLSPEAKQCFFITRSP